MKYGPKTNLGKELHAEKYRGPGENFKDAMSRIADTLADDEDHFLDIRDVLLRQRFLPGGRVQAAIGAPKRVTAYNCFVSSTIEDSMDGIMDVAKEAATTMRLGGGIGYDFSRIRPNGAHIRSLASTASGPLSFMGIFNAVCSTVSSAGNRRGAQMGVLRIDHPDIEAFIDAKTEEGALSQFNLSVAVTDKFMHCLISEDDSFDLVFGGNVYSTVSARALWDKLMRATWDWAEPGVLFIDKINDMNNLYYCEDIVSTNPCGEQPLPPNGACLLGSFNLGKYLIASPDWPNTYHFDWELFANDISTVVRAMDNVIDNTIYPHEAQAEEALNKRRMGLGVAGLANALEIMGMPYGKPDFLEMEEEILRFLANEAYTASVYLAKEKGAFPAYVPDLYLESNFIKTLKPMTRELIETYGIRNSHLISIAPTGTIAITADNISGGIEPVFSHFYDRTVIGEDGVKIERVEDYAFREYGIKGRTANEVTPSEHLAVLATAQKYVDSACSKTINIGKELPWDDFKGIYYDAWLMGCKGVTTFRAAGKRYGVLNTVEEDKEEGGACYLDTVTGAKSCS